MDRILITYASFGEGHKSAAFALRDSLGSECHDLLDFTHPVLKHIYSKGYTIITHNFICIWRILYFFAKKNIFSFLLDRFHQRIFSSYIKHLKETKPKVIIVTQFFPASLIAAVKEELGIKIICIVTDLRVYPLWVNKFIDYYFTTLDITKKDLYDLGVAPSKVVSGYTPIRKGFIEKTPKSDLYKKFGLKEKPTILFMASSRGKLPYLKAVLPDLLDDFNLFIIYGRNKRLKKYLQNLNSPNIRYFSFYAEIWDLISLSSIIVTKPGGLTVFEGIYKHKPFIFTTYIPGQEKENMDVLIKAGIARFIHSKSQFIKAVEHFQKKEVSLNDNYPFEIDDIHEIISEAIEKLANA